MKKLVALLAITALCGCKQGSDAASKGKSHPSASSSAAAPASRDLFAFELYEQMHQGNTNFVIAPAPIAAAVGLAYEGARGDTAAEMAKALHLGANPRAEIDRQAKALGANAGQEVMLAPLDRVWVDKSLPLAEAFKGKAKGKESSLAALDFQGNPEGARKEINAWASERSGGKLSEAAWKSAVDDKTRLLITAGAYFHPRWKHAFDPKLTKRLPFEYAPNREGLAVTMRQTGKFAYAKLEHIELIELPCAKETLSVVFLLPNRRYPLFQVEKALKDGKLPKWLAAAKPREMDIFIPRFTVSTHIGLASPLAKLGMGKAFGPQADFSGLFAGAKGFGLAEIAHHAVVDLDEGSTSKPEAPFVAAPRGSAAASASAAGSRAAGSPAAGSPAARSPAVPSSASSSSSPPSTGSAAKKGLAKFAASRPFVFIVRDTKTSSILFVGRFARP